GTGTARLQAAGDVGQSAAGTITAARLGVRSTAGSIRLDQANAAPVFAAAAPAAGAAVNFRTTGALTLDVVTADGALFAAVAGVTAGGVARLQAAGGVGQTAAGLVTAPTLGVRNAAAGDILLDQPNAVAT